MRGAVMIVNQSSAAAAIDDETDENLRKTPANAKRSCPARLLA
jgi:hypothetical protein